MALKKNTLSILTVVALLLIVAVITVFSSVKESHEKERAANEAVLQRERTVSAALAELENIEKYQRYCMASVLRVEEAGDFVKLISATGGAEQYFRGATSTPCAARTSSTDCRIIKRLAFSEAYSCPNEPVAAAANDSSGVQIQQQAVGNAVIIDTVILERSGFTVVRSIDRAGNPGEILARSALLRPGISKIVSIAMPTSLVAGQKYAVAIALDDGSNEFEADMDSFVKNVDSSALFAVFTVVKK